MCPQSALTERGCLFLLFSAAVCAPSQRGDARFVPGCVRNQIIELGSRADLDPVHCSARCHGTRLAVVATRSGYCGDQKPQSCPSCDCPSQRVVLLPIEGGEGNVAPCGPFLETISFSVSPEQLPSGTTFMMNVFLKMAAPLDHFTGISGLGRRDFSDVTVEFLGMTPKGQSSLRVNMPDLCSFNVSSDCSSEAPGTYEIRVNMSSVPYNQRFTVSQRLVLVGLLGPVADPSCNSPGDAKADGAAVGRSWCLCLGPGQKQEPSNRTSTCHVEIISVDSTRIKRATIRKEEEREPTPNTDVKAHAPKQAYPTKAEVQFSALTDVQGGAEFLWHFGDSAPARTTRRTITKRYRKPGRYNVTVVMVTPGMSVTSEPFPVTIQRAVKVNRLVHRASVRQNHAVTLSCRVNAGTELLFLWTFGDGSIRLGQSEEEHVFQSVGEFLVEVTVFNLVSSASLRSHIFVVDKPCRPPPVKNMGPLTVKVPRFEAISVGVTFESEFDCDVFISGGIRYTWTLYDSTGKSIRLPHTETHRQTLTLPKHFLQYDTYTAVAKVVGSVVYSNYSVKLQVVESAPVAVARGGTNVFINNKNTTVVTLDGTESYDPDFPHNTVSSSWACKPLSIVPSSCFDHEVPMSSPVITFRASSLKQSFDQFRFTLTIKSAGRSASTDVFLTVKADLQGQVSIDCPQCHKDVDWDERFTVRAVCENCQIPPDLIQYSWSLYRVNASSKPVQEVPFCDTVDLSAPSAIKGTGLTLAPKTVISNPSNHRRILKRHRRGDDFFDGFEEDLDPYSSVLPPEYSGDQYESSSNWDFPFPISEKGDFQDGLDLHLDDFLNAEEGESEISPGRTTVEDGESFRLGDEFEAGSHREEGSNLLDVRPPVVKQEQTLLDLSRDPVAQRIFESYTYTGIISPQLSFKPFRLQPGSRFMLEVTASHDSQKHSLGRTQLFFQTKPAPKGVTCQVQPSNGLELLTVFSIFCSSGKEDLLYKYSYNVGNKPPRALYQGTDFEHYFSLPAGEPKEDYEVTVSIAIRSSVDGGTTRPCPVTVRVQPQFVKDASSNDPALELSQIALRNLSHLVRLGNSAEILSYVSIVTNVLNRLDQEPEADTQSRTCLRNALVCIVCGIEATHQVSTLDTIHTLEDLLQIPEQVTLSSVRKLTGFAQAMSEQVFLDQQTLSHMMSLLSLNLKAVSSYSDQNDPSFYNALGHNGVPALNDCLTHSTDALKGSSLAKHLVDSILHTVSLITMRFIWLHKMEDFKLSGGLLSVFATYPNRSATVHGALSVLDLPQSFVQRLDSCVVSVVTELSQNPFTWAEASGAITGPVVELSLFRCSTRRKMPVRFLSQPFDVELQQPTNQSISPEYILHHNKINYHSFNVSHEHLQQVIRLRVQFTSSATRGFPVTLLFRTFEKPTPSDYHLRKMHNWPRRSIHVTLPSNFFNADGVVHLALLNADFENPHKWRDARVSYGVRVESSQCLSWDGPRGAWTPHDCKTKAADTSSAVNCSCHLLHPVTVRQQQISTSFIRGEIDPFVSVSYNWTVVVVLALTLSLYIGALVLSGSTNIVSGERRVHYLSDNLPCEPCLYAVTVHTGLCSAAEMSAKVYLVLCGERGFSQTKELQVSGCSVFRRNSQDTFIVSATESLGSLCGIHIWHDNCGPSPTWYLKHVEVCELNKDHQVKGRTWLFVGQCWLAVDKSDGRVERMLRVYEEKMAFAKVLRFKVWDFMADFHIWISAHSCPNPSSFTRCQRLSVCVLLLLGFACVSTVLISQNDDELYSELDISNFSVIGVTTGIFSVVFVLPAATLVSLLFRLSEVKVLRPEIRCSGEARTENVCFNDALSLTNHKHQDTDLSSVSSWHLDDGDQSNAAINKEDVIVIAGVDETQESCLFTNEKNNDKSQNKAEEKVGLKLSQWCNYAAWILWLLLCMSCLSASAVLGVRFNSKEAALWMQSLFFSLLFCIFLIHPLLVFTMALGVSMRHQSGKTPDNPTFSTHLLQSIQEAIQKCTLHHRVSPSLQQLLEARQRIRFLRLVRPPGSTELRKSRCKRKRDNLIHRTVWDGCVFTSMLFLMLCITYGSSSSDCNNINRAVRKHFISSFMSIRSYEDWWIWAQTSLLKALYKNSTANERREQFAAFQESHILIGEPVLWKTDVRCPEAFNSTLPPNCFPQFYSSANFERPKIATAEAKFSLGLTRTLAESKLKHLQQGIGRSTVALKVHFALYSPAANVFTSVTLNIKQNPFGVLQPSANVQFVTVFHPASQWDCVVLTCKMLFLVLLFLRLCHQIFAISEKGLIQFCQIPRNWLEVALSVVATVYYIYTTYRSVLVREIAETLQRQNYEAHIDFTSLAAWDQTIRSLGATLLFLLTLRCMSSVRKTALPPRSVCSISWILLAGLIGYYSHFQNSRVKPINSTRNVLHHGVAFVLSRLLWTALVMNVVSSSAKCVWRRRDMFTTTDFVQYIKERLFSRWARSTHTDHNMERKTYYFEQFESVLDELLLRLDAITDQTLPSEVYRYEQDSPISSKRENSKTEALDYPQTNMPEPLAFFHSEMSAEFNYLQSKDQTRRNISKRIMLPHKVHEDETKCDKNSAQRQVEKSKGHCTLASLQPVSAEVVVEVLIHEEQDLQHNVTSNNFLNQ